MKAYITRDINGDIFIHVNEKPKKYTISGFWSINEEDGIYFRLSESDLPIGVDPQWSDTEPIEVEFEFTIKTI